MATSQAADLLSRLLEFDYKKRMPVEEALAHPYFADIRDQAWEVSGDDNTLRWGDIDSATPNRLNMQRIILEDAARLNVANVELLKDVERRAQLAAEQHQAATHLAQQQALAQQQQQHRRMAA
jgi:serine/threonine protein kinase